MGATLPFECPVEDCEYETMFRLGMGEEMDDSAHQERVALLRKEHPNHPNSPPQRERLLLDS